MKKLITLLVFVLVIMLSFNAFGQNGRRLANAKLMPVVEFLETNSTLAQWYGQYIKTTTGKASFNDFLKRLSTSEVLAQRGKRAGLSHNQIYSPIATMMGKNYGQIDKMETTELSTIRLSMLELDLALAAIEATIPKSAYVEFRNEVIRGAKPLTEVAKLPGGAAAAMTGAAAYSEKEQGLYERINNPYKQSRTPPTRTDIVKDSNPALASEYMPW